MFKNVLAIVIELDLPILYLMNNEKELIIMLKKKKKTQKNMKKNI